MTGFPILLYTYPFIYLKPKKRISLGRSPNVLKQVLRQSDFLRVVVFFRKMLVEESARLENKHDMRSNTAKI